MATTSRATTPPTTSSSLTAPLDNSAPKSPSSPSGITPTLPTIREDSVLPPAPTSQLPIFAAATTSPKDKSLAFSPRRSPALLTGAAAMADAKRKRQSDRTSRETTPNPAVAAMQSLMGGGGMSKATDAPAPDKLSEPLRQAAEKITIPEGSNNTSAQTSPVSLSSFGAMETNGHAGALTATTSAGSADTLGSQFVAEPADMMNNDTPNAQDDEEGNKAFSYPGLPTQQSEEAGPARGMSLPGFQDGNKASPASKRHKCPYCATDFTRHHNLKSHLLTHSQEKPYVCSTCQARFRRLHDLKRHTKLHTGERPHTCDKCGRRFARGDALARHNKGPGGCAGRRSSFGGDDDMADGMDGVEYTNDDDEEGNTSTTDLARRVSEPSRKRVAVEAPHDTGRTIYRQHSSTYPPIQHRPGDMGPPAVVHPGNNTNSTSPRDAVAPPTLNTGYFQGFQHGGGNIIESPKPLSPGQPGDQHRLSVDQGSSFGGRNRSPSLTTQFQQTHFGRGSIGGRTPPQAPPAQFPSGHMGQSNNNQLPPLTLSTSSAGRTALAGPGPSMLHHQVQNNGSAPASASSQGQSSGSSMRDILGGAGPLGNGSENELWSHLRQLEGKFVRMQDEYELRISRLQEEVISLRSQLGNTQQSGPAGSYPGEPRY